MEFTGIDHFVLTVQDIEATCSFYEALGADVITFGDDRKAVRFGDQKINLHPTENDIGLVADEPTVGGGDFCLLTETPIEEVERRLRERDIDILEGPVGRTGRSVRSRRCISGTPTTISLRSRPTRNRSPSPP